MELRYTTKLYLFNKAIRKTRLTKPEFFMLYTVNRNDGKRLIDIHRTLSISKRETGYNHTIKYLKQLMEKELIQRNKFSYTITPAGVVALNDVENRLRKMKI